MLDAIGNKILEGKIVRFEPPPELLKRMVWTVMYVSDGGIATPEGESPAGISLRLDMPIQNRERGEPRLPEFFVVENPQAAKMIEDLMAGKKN